MTYDETLQAFLGRMPVLGLQSFSLDACLAFRTTLPSRLRTLVASYVNIFRGEDFHDFIEDIVNEFQGFVVAGAKDILADTPGAPYIVRTSCASQFGIGSKGSEHMARHVDFRYDGNMAFSGILHDVATLLLCIESSVGYAVVAAAVMSDDGLRTF